MFLKDLSVTWIKMLYRHWSRELPDVHPWPDLQHHYDPKDRESSLTIHIFKFKKQFALTNIKFFMWRTGASAKQAMQARSGRLEGKFWLNQAVEGCKLVLNPNHYGLVHSLNQTTSSGNTCKIESCSWRCLRTLLGFKAGANSNWTCEFVSKQQKWVWIFTES